VKIGLISDGNLRGTTSSEKIREIVKEAVLADEYGYSCWGTSETHFVAPTASITAPDSIYGAVAAQTERIRIRYMALVITYNHPVQVAERLNTLDAITNGRAELCTARGNNIKVVEAFNVDPSSSRAMWDESMRIIGQAINHDRVNYDGTFWQLDDVEILPRPVQEDPAPALLVVSSGLESHKAAADMGIGVISFDNYLGWDAVDERIAMYKGNLPATDLVSDRPTELYSYYVASAHCAESRAQAILEAEERAFEFVDFALELYEPMRNKPTYEYMSQIKAVESYRRDLDKLMRLGPSIIVGDPDDVIVTLKELERRGTDEVILSIDGISHEKHLKAIELIGKHVLPEFHGADAAATATAGSVPA
jgi:alkanesulfonate monooxygenase SsuD/methylene tetrahydromethanopterin reductase-like flavin-dependent oxidoreductase (luciferase family)